MEEKKRRPGSFTTELFKVFRHKLRKVQYSVHGTWKNILCVCVCVENLYNTKNTYFYNYTILYNIYFIISEMRDNIYHRLTIITLYIFKTEFHTYICI